MPTVLILDDQATNCDIYAKLAMSVGDDIAVQTFGDARKALRWIARNPIDIVITDFKMPEMDGANFTRCLRKVPENIDVPVIVITAYHDRDFRISALEAGASDFILTPVEHHEFITRVRNLLDLRRHQLSLRKRAQRLQRDLERSEKSREKLMRDSREALAQVIDTVPAMISAADRDGKCVFANADFAAAAGVSVADLLGTDAAGSFGPAYAQHSQELDQLVLESGEPFKDIEDEIVDASGARKFLLSTKSPLREAAGRIVGVLTTSVDITERKQAEGRLSQMAHRDPLTGLPNRYVLHKELRLELARGRRGSGAFALHFMDLDRFKAVNDAFGHQVGDSLLKVVAERLKSIVRRGETIARLGGDEFAILQAGVDNAEDAAGCAGRIIAAMAQPFDCSGHTLTVTASVGTTLYPRDGQDADELLRCADLAMYRAKAERPGTFRLFEADMDLRARETMAMEADLHGALKRNELVLHYQPQLDLRSGQVSGVEALLRWQRPGFGLVPPSQFLPLAEENGLIAPINEWVIRTACRQAAAWRRELETPIRMAVNLSPRQFRNDDVTRIITDALADSGLPARQLVLELTEGILLAANSADTLHELRRLGVRISLDDFGTGYSSLSYLKQFPIDQLKIDQTFIRNLDTDQNDAAIVRAIVQLGRSLKLKITAEGVETEAHMKHLRAADCDEVQGYYFSPALPANECRDLLARHIVVNAGDRGREDCEIIMPASASGGGRAT